MALSSDLLSQFAKATTPSKNTDTETTVYGIVVEYEGKNYVRIDGSDRLTPMSTTAQAEPGERVSIKIKNHSATVTGNISSPAARVGSVEEINGLLEVYIPTIEADHAIVETLETTYASIESLNAIEANIDTLEANDVTINEKLTANEADITQLKADVADIGDITADYAKITDLEAVRGEIDLLESDVADIDTLIFGSASGETIQTEFANAVIAQLGDAQIKSAMIQDVSASKITSGEIITNDVTVRSEDGSLLISDETIQISDETRVRVQIGKDASGDYSINIWDANGKLMFSRGGITENAIKEAIIRDDMVTDDADISASKLNIDSLFTVINEDGSNTLKSSKIFLDDEDQTLDVAFTALTTNVDETSKTVTSQGTAISTIQGQIDSKIWQQDITTAIDDIEIGGRNLFLNTNTEASLNHASNWSASGSFNQSYFNGVITFVNQTGLEDFFIYYECGSMNAWLDPSTSYVLSFDIFMNGEGTLRAAIADMSYVSPQTPLMSVSGVCVANEWNHIELPLTTNADIPIYDDVSMQGLYLNCRYATIKTVRLKNLKLERGNKATGWTPAPEDTEGAITSLSTQYSDISQTVDSISLTVASHTTTLDDMETRVSDAETNITQTAEDISLVAERTSAIEGDYITQEKLDAAISVEADNIKLSVSETYATKEALDDIDINVEVDTSNLIRNSNFARVSDSVPVYWINVGLSVCTSVLNSDGKTYLHISGESAGSANCHVYHDTGEFIHASGRAYTLSFDAFSDTAGTVLVSNVAGSLNQNEYSLTTEPTRYSFTYTAESGGSLTFWLKEANTNAYITDVKLEYGEKATTWELAHEDLATDVDVEGVNSGLTEAQDTIDGLRDRIQDAEASIQILSDALINLVTDENGGSLMTQTEDGWTFCIAEVLEQIANNQSNTEDLSSAIDTLNAVIDGVETDLSIVTGYVRVCVDENPPYLLVGATDSDFKVKITNTDIKFLEGSLIPAYVSNQALNIDKAVIENELKVGGFALKKRNNGNVGWTWEGW